MTTSKFLSLIFLTGLSLFIGTHLMAQNTKSKNNKKDPVKSAIPSYEKYIDDNMEAHLKEFIELVSIPSISSIPSHKPDVAKAGAWIVNKLN